MINLQQTFDFLRKKNYAVLLDKVNEHTIIVTYPTNKKKDFVGFTDKYHYRGGKLFKNGTLVSKTSIYNFIPYIYCQVLKTCDKINYPKYLVGSTDEQKIYKVSTFPFIKLSEENKLKENILLGLIQKSIVYNYNPSETSRYHEYAESAGVLEEFTLSYGDYAKWI